MAVPRASEDGLNWLEIDDSRLLDHVERWTFITAAMGIMNKLMDPVIIMFNAKIAESVARELTRSPKPA